MDKRKGRYLGTEIDEKWWKRYTRGGFFARGNGEYWYDDTAFHFQRYLTQDPIGIPLHEVTEMKVGTWHCGQWVWGKPIVKILWIRKGESLSSGFILSYDEDEMRSIIADLDQRRTFSKSRKGA